MLLKRLLGARRETVTVSTGAFFLDPASYLGLALLTEGKYDPGTSSAILHYLRAGMTFMDVGANEGYFSVLAAAVIGPSGRIVSVEPQTRLQEVLRENLRLNGISNATIVAAAISDQEGTALLHVSPDVDTGATGLQLEYKYKVPTQQTSTITLHQLFDRAAVHTCDVMKMDIESFEHEAILGSPEIFAERRVRTLIVEVHDRLLRLRGKDAGEIKIFLSACGYKDRSSPSGNTVYTLEPDDA